MKLAALFSGGKDSTYAILLAQKQGHDVVKLATVFGKPESYMYHTANIGLTVLQAETMGMELVTRRCNDDVGELESLLAGLGVEGVVCGAIRSEYQRSRVAAACEKLNMELVAPLWHADEEEYLRSLVRGGFEAVITAVAADGFDESWLGRKIDDACIDDLLKLRESHGISIVGEGGEYETAVLSCPLFSKRIVIAESKKVWNGDSGELQIVNARLS